MGVDEGRQDVEWGIDAATMRNGCRLSRMWDEATMKVERIDACRNGSTIPRRSVDVKERFHHFWGRGEIGDEGEVTED